ncbi:hypothetical protein [Ramlibacter sp.]|uniref:hypothetical protein n=1 Tax=Ramlibacter sp. TaxID=1917967 RepID=UPI003D0D87FD
MSPAAAGALLAAYPPTRPALAALPAARPRFVLLAPIHVPWPFARRARARLAG